MNLTSKISKSRSRLAGLAIGLAVTASIVGPVSPVAAGSIDAELGASAETGERSAGPSAKASNSIAKPDKVRRMPEAPSDKLVPPNCGIVPNVVGMTIDEAIAAIEAASPLFWVYLDYGYVPEGQAEIGTIFFQSVNPGTLLFDCDEMGVEGMIGITAVAGYVP